MIADGPNIKRLLFFMKGKPRGKVSVRDGCPLCGGDVSVILRGPALDAHVNATCLYCGEPYKADVTFLGGIDWSRWFPWL